MMIASWSGRIAAPWPPQPKLSLNGERSVAAHGRADLMGTSYTCAMYVHLRDSTRFLLVCENDPLPLLLDPRSWRLVAHGVEPPDRARPWLKMNRYYQIHHFPDEVS